MDPHFRIICKPQFDRVGPFYDGLAWVVVGKRGGYINEQFQWVVPLALTDLEDFAEGMAS